MTVSSDATDFARMIAGPDNPTHSFVDRMGRTWVIMLNITTVKRVKALCGVDLMSAVNDGGKLLERLTGDPILLCDVIFALCKDQADTKNITDVDFGCAMAGDPIEAATTALLEELVDFFPRGKRAVLRRALQKMRLYEEKFLKAAHLKLDDPRMDAAVEKKITDLLSSMPGDSSGNAPGS